MRFEFDPRKSSLLSKNPRRGIGFEEAQAIFDRPYYLDQRNDVPEQFRAIGWVGPCLYSLIFEVREDEQGEYYHLVTLWRASHARNSNFMKSKPRSKKVIAAEEIAEMADKGRDVSRFFTGKGRMMQPAQRVNVDFAAPMLNELDDAAKELNISRQALIKTLVRQALDQHYVARRARQNSAGS